MAYVNSKLPSQRAVVTRDFEPLLPDTQLAVSENEVLLVIERHFKGWYKLRTIDSMHEGWVPQDCVEIMLPLEANFDFSDDDERTLNFKAGDILLGTKMGEWWLGCSSDEFSEAVGYIPGSFVAPRPLKQAPNPPLSTEPDPSRPVSTWVGSKKDSGSRMSRKSSRGNLRSAIASVRLPRKSSKKNVKGGNGTNPVYKFEQEHGAIQSPGPQNEGDIVTHGLSETNVKVAGAELNAKPFRKIPTRGSMKDIDDKVDEKPPPKLEFALYATNLGYACAFTLISFGVLACVWDSKTYADGGSLGGKYETGIYSIGIGLMIVPLENWIGNWRPANDWEHKYNVPIRAISYLAFSINCFTAIPTIVPGIFMIITSIVNFIAFQRGEQGIRKSKPVKFPTLKTGWIESAWEARDSSTYFGFPSALYAALVKEDHLLQLFWLFIYFLVNITLWSYAYSTVLAIVEADRERIKNGPCEPLGIPGGIFDIDGGCLDTLNEGSVGTIDRCLLEFGALSNWGPVAKGFGSMLNMNCALILMPVVRNLLKRLNKLTEDNPKYSIIKYIPLGDNITSHKLFALVILFAVWGHTMAHFINFSIAPDMTLCLFNRAGPWDQILRVEWGNDGQTAWYTGGLILLAMFIMYSAANDTIRHESFEIFFFAHHFFILFYSMLLFHGPVFLWWGCIPIGLYIWERRLQQDRGSKRWFVNIANWIPPVLELQIRPENKEDFKHVEGEYLFLNCPAISEREWHPFTISSAHEDLVYGHRVESSTGKEAIPIVDQKQGQQFGMAIQEETKYTVTEQDSEGKITKRVIPKWQTEWNDFVSVHIKVHKGGWTEKLKNYLELKNTTKKYPSHFTRRNEKGENVLGMEKMPSVGWNHTIPIPQAGELLPILRVDGPHSAPAIHYAEYPTVMLVGGGIGLTPCAAILTAVIRWKWKKNFPPDVLNFYWVLRQGEVDAFFWMMKRLASLEEELLSQYWYDQDVKESFKRFKVHIYITSYKKDFGDGDSTIGRQKSPGIFGASELRKLMLHPPVKAKDQFTYSGNENRLMSKDGTKASHICVWNGRPDWDKVFKDVKKPMGAGPGSVGVFFCGNPIIGRDLARCSSANSNPALDQQFHLHKENF